MVKLPPVVDLSRTNFENGSYQSESESQEIVQHLRSSDLQIHRSTMLKLHIWHKTQSSTMESRNLSLRIIASTLCSTAALFTWILMPNIIFTACETTCPVPIRDVDSRILDNQRAHGHQCEMDVQNAKVEKIGTPYVTYRESITSLDGSPNNSNFRRIRVHYDTHYMFRDIENRTCYPGQDYFRQGNPKDEQTLCTDSLPSDCLSPCEDHYIVTRKGAELFQNEVLDWISQEKLPSLLKVRSVEKLSLPERIERCGSDGGFPILTEHTVPNSIEADLLIYITSRPPTPGVLGYAIPCFIESDFDRIIVAQINIAPEVLEMSLAVKRGIALHETIHALGFSSFSFLNFRDKNGNKRDPNNVFTTHTQNHTASDGNTYQQNVAMLTTPTLVKLAREHFACDSLRGINLEEYGSLGTVNSHWDRHALLNELMIGSVSWFNPSGTWSLSKFTLAVLEDSGWYQVNYSGADPILWGKGVGCDLPQKRCELWDFAEQFDGYFCKDKNEDQCTFNLRGKGHCGIKEWDHPLQFYEHFPDQPSLGGTSPAASYCPLVYQSMNCLTGQPAEGIASLRNSDSHPDMRTMEHFGPDAGCFHSTVRKTPVLDKKGQSLQCLQYSCDRTDRKTDAKVLSIRIGSTWLDCPAEQNMYIFNSSMLPDGFDGTLVCPRKGYDILCEYELPEMAGSEQRPFPQNGSLVNDGSSSLSLDLMSLWMVICIIIITT